MEDESVITHELSVNTFIVLTYVPIMVRWWMDRGGANGDKKGRTKRGGNASDEGRKKAISKGSVFYEHIGAIM